MAALTDLSDIVNRVTGGNNGTPEHLFFYKEPRLAGTLVNNTVGGRWTSLWQWDGVPSGGANVDTTGVALDNTSSGGLKQADPGGGRQKWCLGVVASPTVTGTTMLYDRLAHDGGFDGTSTAAQTVSFTPPSRYSTGAGNMIFLEIQGNTTTVLGATATTVTASYTDQAGNAGHTTQAVAIGGTGLREGHRMIPLTLASGDTGVRNVASITLALSTGTAGDIAVVLAHPLAYIPAPNAGLGGVRDFITGLPSVMEIQTDACLALNFLAQSTTPPQLFGSVHMVEA